MSPIGAAVPLDNALKLVQHCDRLYANAEGEERRMLNQGFFTKLPLDEDGSVEYADAHEPFASIMTIDPDTKVQRSRVGRSLSWTAAWTRRGLTCS